MAVKEIPIVVKVDGKQLDVLKTSVNEFEQIYGDAQKKLRSLPLGSDEWKTLNNEIKNADKTFNQTKEILVETESKFKSLKVQIRQATVAFQEAEEKGDIKSMKKLKKDLDDLGDQLEITQLKSMEFQDALATMPGIAGFVGQSIQGVDKAFKVLAANPVLAIVTAVVGAFSLLKEALSKTKAGQDALNKVSQAFSTVLGPILALINTVAVPIFEKLAWVIGKVGEGFSWVAEKMGVSKKEIAQATKDVDKVGQEAAEKEKDRLEKLKQQREKEAADRKQKAEAAKKLAQDTINTNETLKQSEEELARAKKKASEDPIQAMKDEQTQKDIDFKREKQRIEDLKKVKGTTALEQKALTTELNNLEAEYLKDKTKRTEDIKKQELDIVQQKKEANALLLEESIKAIKDETERSKAERKKQYNEEVDKFKELLKKKLITQDQYNVAIKDATTSLNNDLEKIDDDNTKKENEKRLKKLDDDLKFLQTRAAGMVQGTISYFDLQREIQQKALERELEDLKMSDEFKKMSKQEQEDAITAIQAKAAKDRRDLDKQELDTYLGYATNIVSAISSVYSNINDINQKQQELDLKKAGDNFEEQEKIKKKYFEKNKNNQIAQAWIATFQAAIQAYQALAGIPIVGPILGGIAAAAAIYFGTQKVNQIKATQYEGGTPPGGSGAAAAPPVPDYGKNYGDGGLIDGPRHSQGGVPINAEGGEAIMTRGAVTMFAPILSALNQMGGGTSFSKGAAGQANYDNPKTSSPESQSPVILKTYVVSSELTTEQQKQARLKDLSTL